MVTKKSALADVGTDCQSFRAKKDQELAARKEKKVNTASCKCSGCRSDSELPVLGAKADVVRFNTGYDGQGGALTDGAADMRWEWGMGDASGPGSVSNWSPATIENYGSPWASPPPNANYLGLGDAANGHYYCRYRFNLAAMVDLSQFHLDVNLHADDQIHEIYVNGVAQSSTPNGAGLLPGGGFGQDAKLHIDLNNAWRRCDNEVIVQIENIGGGPTGLLVFNAVEVPPGQQEDPCECNCKCKTVEWPQLRPCISVKWGDSECDCIESNDLEVLYVTVCNCYANASFSNVSMGQIRVTDLAGNPVPLLPDGTPSVQVVPSGPICFGDIAPCKDEKNPSCVTREVALYTRGAKAGDYRISFDSVCFTVCQHTQTTQCVVVSVCRD
ncbi:MAG: hypothetical protein C4K60_15725 [Ideonella sp. MAG2]|nr:MAG: hypothetical protein C4K60_15725 [Ideonella sp. MAG2]